MRRWRVTMRGMSRYHSSTYALWICVRSAQKCVSDSWSQLCPLQVNFKPFNKSLRNCRCMRCGEWGHRSGGRLRIYLYTIYCTRPDTVLTLWLALLFSDRECPMANFNPHDEARKNLEVISYPYRQFLERCRHAYLAIKYCMPHAQAPNLQARHVPTWVIKSVPR